MTEINLFYSSIDGYESELSFDSLDAAREYAQKRVGETPEMGTTYAVSSDGIGKIEVDGGCTLADLFPKLAA